MAGGRRRRRWQSPPVAGIIFFALSQLVMLSCEPISFRSVFNRVGNLCVTLVAFYFRISCSGYCRGSDGWNAKMQQQQHCSGGKDSRRLEIIAKLIKTSSAADPWAVAILRHSLGNEDRFRSIPTYTRICAYLAICT